MMEEEEKGQRLFLSSFCYNTSENQLMSVGAAGTVSEPADHLMEPRSIMTSWNLQIEGDSLQYLSRRCQLKSHRFTCVCRFVFEEMKLQPPMRHHYRKKGFISTTICDRTPGIPPGNTTPTGAKHHEGNTVFIYFSLWPLGGSRMTCLHLWHQSCR